MKIFHWGMNNPITGAPFSWDDANVQWGEPACYLEPGDPGFVPYPGKDSDAGATPFAYAALEPPEKITSHAALFGGPSVADIFARDAVAGLGAEADGSTMDSAVAEITGIPADKCAEVLGAYLDQLLVCAADSPLAREIYALLSICPSAGHWTPGANGFQRPLAGIPGEAPRLHHRRF